MKLVKTLISLMFMFSVFSAQADKLAHLRSSRKIVTEDVVRAPHYTIQVVALKEPPQNASFFQQLDQVREFVCSDGFVRYTVGAFASFSDAARELEAFRAQGYTDAFVLNTRKITLKGSAQTPVIDKNAAPVAGTSYTVQLAAYRFPVYVSEFSEFSSVQEYYMRDKIYRYCVENVDGADALRVLAEVQAKGYPDAFLVPLEKYRPFRIE